MKVDIYKSKETGRRYFVVPAGGDTSGLPEEVEDQPEKSIETEEGENRIGISGPEAISEIEDRGFHSVDIQVQTTESIDDPAL